MAFKFYQTRPNMIKHDQTALTKQGVQTVKCLVTKQCLMHMVFGRQTFPFVQALKKTNLAATRAFFDP